MTIIEEKKKKKKSRKKCAWLVLRILIFLIGFGIFAYPFVSAWWNSLGQAKIAEGYMEEVAGKDYTDEWAKVHAYNEALNAGTLTFPTKEEIEEAKEKEAENFIAKPVYENEDTDYRNVLDVCGNGVMGVIEIPKIVVKLPIYHGTEETVLKVGAGHFYSSSLPEDCENRHVVLSGHRGLPSSTLFTHLDKMEVGDTFTLNILDKTFTYEVDDISVVLPEETDSLGVVEGENYCTLVTCTPYGINTHRLLIRGKLVN